LPFIAAAYTDSDFWKTMWQTWGVTGSVLAGAKVVTDVSALALKSTLIGQRMFAPENTARDVRVQSNAAQLPAISVGPGLGLLPGLTGYGKAPVDTRPAGCPHVGAGSACCASCAGKDGKVVTPPAPGTPQAPPPITGTTPLPTQVEAPNAGNNPTANMLVGAGGVVTEINKFAPKNRFDKKRFG